MIGPKLRALILPLQPFLKHKLNSMKFRRLNQEELSSLEAEFIRFLASNTITAEEWKRLKSEENEKAEGLIDIFSDLVFENTLKKVEYLELKTPRDLRTFHCEAEKITMFGLLIEGETQLDLTKTLVPEQMIAQLKLSGASLKLYSGEKSYRKAREQELFDLMEQGALISRDGHLFKTLQKLKS